MRWLTFTIGPHLLALLTLLALAGPAAAGPAELPLAAEGKAHVPIVVSEKASPATRQVAAELAAYLGRIAGATFEVIAGDGSRGIVLGTLAEFPNPALAGPLAVRGPFDGREAFAIRTEPARVLLIGATDLGASHAAYRFLERLGCRWFFPASEWEVVPSRRTLTVSVEETDRPKILARRIWYGYGVFADAGHPTGGSAREDYAAWAFSPHAHGHLWFFNAPNVLAASPDAFLLPKDLVARDGLPTPGK